MELTLFCSRLFMLQLQLQHGNSRDLAFKSSSDAPLTNTFTNSKVLVNILIPKNPQYHASPINIAVDTYQVYSLAAILQKPNHHTTNKTMNKPTIPFEQLRPSTSPIPAKPPPRPPYQHYDSLQAHTMLQTSVNMRTQNEKGCSTQLPLSIHPS